MPGAMIAIARLNIPAIFVYGGTIKPGHLPRPRPHRRQRVRGGRGSTAPAASSEQELHEVERARLPRQGLVRRHVHRQHHVVGVRGDGHEPAPLLHHGGRGCREGRERRPLGRGAGERGAPRAPARAPSSRGRRSRTRSRWSWRWAASTNAVLHLLAIAHSAGVPLALDDFEAIRARVPVLCDLKPSGRYVATDLHAAGGVPQVMKMLLAHGLLHGDALTITGETIAENLRDVPDDAARRPGRDPAVGASALRAGPSRHAARQPGARGRGREDHRRQAAAHHRPGPRVRVARRHASTPSWPAGSSPGDVHRDSLRGAARRAGHAGDAGADVGDHRRGAGRFGRPASPTDASRAAPTGWWSATSRPRRRSAGRSRSSRRATASRSTPTSACSPSTSARTSWPAGATAWTPPAPRYTAGVLLKYARQVSSASLGAVTDL